MIERNPTKLHVFEMVFEINCYLLGCRFLQTLGLTFTASHFLVTPTFIWSGTLYHNLRPWIFHMFYKRFPCKCDKCQDQIVHCTHATYIAVPICVLGIIWGNSRYSHCTPLSLCALVWFDSNVHRFSFHFKVLAMDKIKSVTDSWA